MNIIHLTMVFLLTYSAALAVDVDLNAPAAGSGAAPGPGADSASPPSSVIIPPLESPPGDPTAYRLGQAEADAQQLNDTSEVAAARLAQAIALRQEAYALVKPTITATGALNSTSISGRPWGNRPVNYAGGTAGIGMTLFNASAYPALKAAQATVSQQEYLSAELRRQLSFQVVSSYLVVISAEQNRQAAQQILTVTQQSLNETRARAKVGLVSMNDATRSELDVANAELAVTNDAQAVTASRLSLGDLVGHLVDQPLQDPGPADLPPGDSQQLESLAEVTRPDLQASRLQVKIEDDTIRADRLLIVPTIGVLGTYANRDYHPDQTPALYPSWTIALTANWTIYDGGLREGEINVARALRRQAAAIDHGARRDLHRDLATAISNLSAQQAAVTQSDVSVRVATLNVQEVKTRYTQGLDTQLLVSDAESALFTAEVGRIAARLNYASVRYQLRQLVGWWPLSDVDPAPERSGQPSKRSR